MRVFDPRKRQRRWLGHGEGSWWGKRKPPKWCHGNRLIFLMTAAVDRWSLCSCKSWLVPSLCCIPHQAQHIWSFIGDAMRNLAFRGETFFQLIKSLQQQVLSKICSYICHVLVGTVSILSGWEIRHIVGRVLIWCDRSKCHCQCLWWK